MYFVTTTVIFTVNVPIYTLLFLAAVKSMYFVEHYNSSHRNLHVIFIIWNKNIWNKF